MKVGFIGLGTMGGGMALNLRKAGYDLIVYDVRIEAGAPLLEAGAQWGATVADVGRVADVVFTSLPGPQEMQTVGMGSGGLCHTLRPGAVWFDLTTNSPTVVREVGRHCTAKGLALLDSPVSGGPAGARSGKLAMYVGGDEATFTRYRALLDAIGDQVMYVGSIGAGNCAKLVHNCASFTIRTAIAEVFTLGVKAGVAPLALWHAIRQGVSGRRRTFDGIGEQYLQDRYQPAAFALRLAHKDMTLARGLAQELGVPMKLADAAHEDMAAGVARGWGDWDSRAFMQLQNERAGVNIKVSAEDVARTLARD